MAHKKPPKLPESGDAFAVPFDDGRFAVCRVILDATSDEARDWGQPVVFIAGSAWIGTEIPRVDDPALRPILHLNHHLYKNEPNILWVAEEVPGNFVPLGKIEPTVDEKARVRMTFGRWEHVAMQPLLQWRWDHDREAVLADDAVAKKAEAERYTIAQEQRNEYLGRVTLEELRRRRFFPNWTIPLARFTRASRKLMLHAVERLLELGPSAREEARIAILQECIESFNALNDGTGFIETDEREDICAEFEAIVHACGLGAHEDLADRWREW